MDAPMRPVATLVLCLSPMQAMPRMNVIDAINDAMQNVLPPPVRVCSVLTATGTIGAWPMNASRHPSFFPSPGNRVQLYVHTSPLFVWSKIVYEHVCRVRTTICRPKEETSQ